MTFTIRPFVPTDDEYAAMVAVHNAEWPDEGPAVAADWQENDREWPASALFQRFVAEQDGQLVGVGACFESYWQHQPGTIHLDITARPEAVGVYEALFDHLQGFLETLTPSPAILAMEAREDRTERGRFLEDRGFTVNMRSPRAALAVAEHDPVRFQGLAEKLLAQGIQILTLHELKIQAPDWKERLHELRWALIQDVPAVEPPTRPTLAEFERMILEDPALDPAAWFVAVDGRRARTGEVGPLVGMSNLWINDPDRKRLDTGLTGVVRDYRRRGIATVLKLGTIAFARSVGAHTIETHNEENNPMYTLNLRLGFQPKTAWVSYRYKNRHKKSVQK